MVTFTYTGPDADARRSGLKIETTGASNESGESFRVTWCNRWDLIDELVARGRMRRVHRGPATYGHVDYYYTP